MKNSSCHDKKPGIRSRYTVLLFCFVLSCVVLLLSSCDVPSGLAGLLHINGSNYTWDGSVSVSVTEAEGLRITSQNPLSVPFGSEAAFNAELDEGWGIDSISWGGTYSDGKIVLKKAWYPTTLRIKTKQLSRCAFSLVSGDSTSGTVERSMTEDTCWEDTVVHLKAVPDSHFKFVGYSEGQYLVNGGKLITADAETDYKVTKDSAVYANFERVSSEIKIMTAKGITITTENPVTVPVGGSCSFGYTLEEGYVLDKVAGGVPFDGKTITLTNVKNPALLTLTVAKLSKFNFSVKAVEAEGGTVSASSTGTMWERTPITVEAKPNTDYEFIGYSFNTPSTEPKDLVATTPKYSFTLAKNTALIANFKLKTVRVSLDLSDGSGVIPIETDDMLVPIGHDAEFPVRLGDRVIVDSISEGAEFRDGMIVLPAVRKDTVIKIVTHRPSQYKFTLLLNDNKGGKLSSNIKNGTYAPSTDIDVEVTTISNGYMFTGFSFNAPLSNGGTLASNSADYITTLEGDTVLYANFVTAPDPALNAAVPSGKWAIIYHPNGGLNTKTQNHTSYRTEYFSNTYFWCPNAIPDKGEFTREGYVLLGYNTKQDGTGAFYAPGWNIIMPEGRDAITLYCVWAKESNPADFSFSNGKITKYYGNDPMVVIPEKIGGVKVTTLGKGMIANNQDITSLVISKNISTVEDRILTDCKNFTTLYSTNNVTSFSDTWYAGCANYNKFIVMAARNPGYCITSSWNATYGIAWQLMMTVKTPKMVVISGSNTAYGIDSRIIKERLAAAGYNYEVINYGQNASTPAVMYIEFCSHFMNKGDLMLLNPEVNSYQYGYNEINTTTWQILDRTYDALSYLDITHYSKVYSGFAAYNKSSLNNAGKNYTYELYDKRINRWGDHQWEKNGTTADQAKSFDGLESKGGSLSFNSGVSYIKNATYIANYNRVLDMVAARGATVMNSFASAVSCNLTKASLEAGGKEQTAYENAVDTYVHTNRISKVNDYIYDRKYFYNSVYHLNNEGQKMRTELVSKDIIAFLNTKK